MIAVLCLFYCLYVFHCETVKRARLGETERRLERARLGETDHFEPGLICVNSYEPGNLDWSNFVCDESSTFFETAW
jgi:hypothetical protein